ncbi:MULTISPECIES: VOC family protein [Streptomyces]|jgi:catechol 2,3-dioxygenase-like lactoylglutathione lyase family enzyme|uniref:VOC family protein n=1 Tax=Streptomyces TaxID=1883 RepID=UPI0027DEADE6|nr:VOC family protein [Streptomyces plumbidurans]
MTTIKIANAQFWVHDQDEALAFYTDKLGWEVRADVTMEAWSFRWLCVGPPGGDGPALVLMPVPRQPMLDEAASAQLSDLVAKGAGGTLFLETDDCKAAYDELSARGVQFNDRRRSSRTASTRPSVTPRATTSASLRCWSSTRTAADPDPRAATHHRSRAPVRRGAS